MKSRQLILCIAHLCVAAAELQRGGYPVLSKQVFMIVAELAEVLWSHIEEGDEIDEEG